MILKRLGISVFVLLAVSLLVFFFTLLLPGDPAQAILGQQATPERLAALREQLDLNAPWYERYLSWLGGLLVGDLGTSAATGGSVNALLASKVSASVVLMAIAAVIAIPVGLMLGTWSAMRRGRAADQGLTGISLVLAALPEYATFGAYWEWARPQLLPNQPLQVPLALAISALRTELARVLVLAS